MATPTPQINLITHKPRPAGRKLGRHRLINWYEFASMRTVPPDAPIKSVWHPPVDREPLDQGSVGACTGYATAECLSTAPYTRALTSAEALAIYSRATQIDGIDGVYPPEDTGSTGWAAMRAAVDLGLCGGFSMSSTLTGLLVGLQTVPVTIGIPWMSGCDAPDITSGLVRPTGELEGGHELCVVGCDVDDHTVVIRNSWGDWGVQYQGGAGYFLIGWTDLEILLASGGDVCIPYL